MKTGKSALFLVVLLVTLLASGLAFAAGHSGWGGGHWGGGHWGGYWGGGHFYFRGGAYWWGPWWYYPYYYPYAYSYTYPYSPYYYPSAYYGPSTPQNYIEQYQPESSPPKSEVWYYCRESKVYYPYVKKCPGGWQTVPAQPPSE